MQKTLKTVMGTIILITAFIPIKNYAQTPITVEAEGFSSSSGGMYGVITDDVGGGEHLVGINFTSWMDYTLNITQTGNYDVSFRMASPQSNGQFLIQLGSNTLATVNFPNTGGWDGTHWQTVTVSNVALTAIPISGGGYAPQTIRIQLNVATCNFNWMKFTYTGGGNQPPIANAGTTQTISLPNNQVTLSGSGTAGNGGIISHTWSKFSGGSANISDPADYGTTVTGLSQGTYVFRLTVEQTDHQTDSKNVTIIVNPAPTVLPIANGGTGTNSLSTGYLKSNGSVVSSVTTIPGSAISGDISGNAAFAGNVLNTVPINKGGTAATDANGALANLLPNQSGNGERFLKTNGTTTSWAPVSSGGSSQWLDVNASSGGGVRYPDKVLIGLSTTSQNDLVYKLYVNGGIRARKAKVDIDNWSDYVFEKTYHLPTLAEVEKYIQDNKHLPGVPSAKEVEKQGLDLGESQATLLKKIEELTLYLIEQNKRIEEQNKRIEQLEETIKKNQVEKDNKDNK